MFEWERLIEDKDLCEKNLLIYLRKGVIKKEEEKESLTKSRLNKTNYNLDFVNFLSEQKRFYDWIIVGCYYTIYQASLALLSTKGYSSKNHSATLWTIRRIRLLSFPNCPLEI